MSSTEAHPTPGWFDISTPDAPRARAFYKDLFGWNINVLDDTYSLVSAKDEQQPSAGIGQAGPDSPYVGIVLYFRVEDVDTALAQAEKLGGTRTLEPQSVPGMGRLAVFTDPDGNNVGVMSS
jgi:predicted enzyme related to lactoylglutathione lyase